MSQEKILHLLRWFANELEQQRVQSMRAELQDANRFNPLRFLKTDETGISDILAFLLNPEETHGQRDLFLNSFLKAIGRSDFLAYDKVEVVCEKMLQDSMRRHDIWLSGSLKGKRKWVVSIENKLRGAGDQNEQIADYWQDLQCYASAENCHIVYLPVWGDNPSQESVSEEEWQDLLNNRQASVLSAGQIIEWLADTPIVAPALKEFTADFQRFLKEEIMGKIERSDELVKQIIEDKNLLISALTLMNQKEVIYDYLTETLVQQLQEKCMEAYPKLANNGWKIGRSSSIYVKYAMIGFSHETDAISIRLESLEPVFKKICYGIWCYKDGVTEATYQSLGNYLTEISQQEGTRRTKWWLAWKYYREPHLENWTPKTWQGVNTGELAEAIFQSWQPFLNSINSYFEQGLPFELK